MTQPFTPEEQQRIIDAIRQAELGTSGEIRVHVEASMSAPLAGVTAGVSASDVVAPGSPGDPAAGGDPVQRAIAVFGQLGMHQTNEQNGVLFYLATADRKFAVIGDRGINAVVPPDFWNSTKELLRQHFAAGQYTEGLCQGIAEAGRHLKQFFPRAANDTNELSDDISFS